MNFFKKSVFLSKSKNCIIKKILHNYHFFNGTLNFKAFTKSSFYTLYFTLKYLFMKPDYNETEPVDEETQYLLDQLYSMAPTKMVLPDGTEEPIDPDGNIGMVAYGYQGIIAWRKKREEVFGSRFYSPFVAMLIKNMKKRKEAGHEQKK